jgi:hypothetical protein
LLHYPQVRNNFADARDQLLVDLYKEWFIMNNEEIELNNESNRAKMRWLMKWEYRSWDSLMVNNAVAKVPKIQEALKTKLEI